MSNWAITADDRRQWSVAGAVVLAAHVGVVALVLALARPADPVVPEPVVLVELPPDAAPAPSVAAVQTPEQVQPVTPQTVTPPIDIPPVRAPLPQNPVTVPPPVPQPVRSQPAPVAPPLTTAPAGTGTGATPAAGNDPRARQQEQDYFSLVSAHLNRRKTYPTEAKRARAEGVVVVRFTVARDGSVSGISIKRGSGHEVLDSATLALVQRVAPLPRMPASMVRDSVTLALPIDYSLKTN